MLITYPTQCIDSIGAHYTYYPTPWIPIRFSGENPDNSTRFLLKGNKATAVKFDNKPKFITSAVTYPNPASGNITFDVMPFGNQAIPPARTPEFPFGEVRGVFIFAGNFRKTLALKALKILSVIFNLFFGPELHFFQLRD